MGLWKKMLCAALTLALCCAGLTLASAEEEPSLYNLGDQMEDFTVTLADGTQTSLYGLLETKQAVLINLWATWCGPCQMEFPYMQEAYLKAEDQVGVVALSIEETDTSDVILAFQQENGIEELPMGQDTIGLGERFYYDGIPTSILVDRFGVICWQETGSITSTDKFDRLFAGFLGDDYTESKVGYAIPGPKPTVDALSSEDLSAALNVGGGELVFDNDEDEDSWPFVANEDGQLVSSNAGFDETKSVVKTAVTAKAGDVLAFDYATSAEECFDYLSVAVNGEVVDLFAGVNDWSSYAYAFETDGDYEVTLAYVKDGGGSDNDDLAMIDNVRLLSGDAAADALAANPVYPLALTGEDYELRLISEGAKEVSIVDESGLYAENYPGKAYIVPADTAKFKALLGDAWNPRMAMALGDNDSEYIDLSKTEHDEEGYFFTVSLAKVEDGGYCNTYVYLCPDQVNDPEEAELIYIYASEENLNYFCQVDLKEYFGLEGVTWTYADGTAPSTDAVAQAGGQGETPEGYAEYTLHFVDQDGNPVEGVMAQVCDDETCEVFPSDESGTVQCQKALYAYEIHVLMVPDGYAFDTAQTFTMPEAGGELTIELTKE